MALRPVYGHERLRARLAAAAGNDQLPASLLLEGPLGVGKQRLALWLGQFLLCDRAVTEQLPSPCGSCPQCRYAEGLVHPDLHWVFPRPKLKKSDAKPAEFWQDLKEAATERVEADGLWAPSSGSDAIFVDTIRALIDAASKRPAMARRSVFVVGNAERMVAQEGADMAANAFLKLLEEPPAGMTLILTTSEKGALLPTIRSRVVTLRMAPLSPDEMMAMVRDPAMQRKLGTLREDDAIAAAGGAPGILLAAGHSDEVVTRARELVAAALLPTSADGTATRVKVAAKQGNAGARGAFSDMLDATTALLHDRTKALVHAGHEADARRTARALLEVEQAKRRAYNNISPQLITAALLDAMHQALRA